MRQRKSANLLHANTQEEKEVMPGRWVKGIKPTKKKGVSVEEKTRQCHLSDLTHLWRGNVPSEPARHCGCLHPQLPPAKPVFPPPPKVCFCLTRAQMSIKLAVCLSLNYVSSSSSSSLSHTYTHSITYTHSFFPSYLIPDNLCLLSGCRARARARALIP
jgi:hypothetical protein